MFSTVVRGGEGTIQDEEERMAEKEMRLLKIGRTTRFGQGGSRHHVTIPCRLPRMDSFTSSIG